MPWARVHVTVQTRCPSVPGPQRHAALQGGKLRILALSPEPPEKRSHRSKSGFQGSVLVLAELLVHSPIRRNTGRAFFFVCFFHVTPFFFCILTPV